MSSSTDPFEYISKMRNAEETIKKLNLDIKDVMQFFFLEGMSEEFKNHLVLLTGKTRPTVEEMNPYLFEASERYMNHKKEKPSEKPPEMKKENSSVSLAANVNCSPKSLNKPHLVQLVLKLDRMLHIAPPNVQFTKSPVIRFSKLRVSRAVLSVDSLHIVLNNADFDSPLDV